MYRSRAHLATHSPQHTHNTNSPPFLPACLAPCQVVAVSLHDVSEPCPLALPRFVGEIYIYAALVLGGVWLFSTTPLVIMLGVMVVSVLAAALSGRGSAGTGPGMQAEEEGGSETTGMQGMCKLHAARAVHTLRSMSLHSCTELQLTLAARDRSGPVAAAALMCFCSLPNLGSHFPPCCLCR